MTKKIIIALALAFVIGFTLLSAVGTVLNDMRLKAETKGFQAGVVTTLRLVNQERQENCNQPNF
jgi:cyanate permease